MPNLTVEQAREKVLGCGGINWRDDTNAAIDALIEAVRAECATVRAQSADPRELLGVKLGNDVFVRAEASGNPNVDALAEDCRLAWQDGYAAAKAEANGTAKVSIGPLDRTVVDNDGQIIAVVRTAKVSAEDIAELRDGIAFAEGLNEARYGVIELATIRRLLAALTTEGKDNG